MNKYEKMRYEIVQSDYNDKIDYELLRELVERATPKKPIYCKNSDTYECDDCGRKLSVTFKFCPKCGQALDWREQ